MSESIKAIFEKMIELEQYADADQLILELIDNGKIRDLPRKEVLPLLYRIGYVYPDLAYILSTEQRRDVPQPFIDCLRMSLKLTPSNRIYSSADRLVSIKSALYQNKSLRAKLLLYLFFKYYDILPISLIQNSIMTVGNNSKKINKIFFEQKITTIVTSYNSSKFISNCLQGLMNQTLANHEIIVVDDCSTDDTVDLIRHKFPLINVIPLSKNRGTYYARNVGLSQATGQYVTFQDSDDWSHPERLELQLKSLVNQPNLTASFSKFFRVNIDTGLPDCRQLYPLLRLNLSSIMIERQDLLDLGGFDDSQRVESDKKLIDKLKRLNRSLYTVDKPLAVGSFRPDSLTSSTKFGFNRYGFSKYRNSL